MGLSRSFSIRPPAAGGHGHDGFAVGAVIADEDDRLGGILQHHGKLLTVGLLAAMDAHGHAELQLGQGVHDVDAVDDIRSNGRRSPVRGSR